MTWHAALDLWRRIDGAVWFGISVYLYLSLRRARRKLREKGKLMRQQDVIIKMLIAVAHRCGVVFVFKPNDPSDEEEDESPRLH